MKRTFTPLLLVFILISTSSLISKVSALNYTISFSGTGASTTVDNVVVKNITKNISVTVPLGNTLNLTDVLTSVHQTNQKIESPNLYPNPFVENSTLSFNLSNDSQVQITAFDLNGKKVIEVNKAIPKGFNTFDMSLPKGIYTIQLWGGQLSYCVKAISLKNSNTKPQIAFRTNSNNQKKSKSESTTLLYNTGDLLLYKATSGNYCTIVTDRPSESKTTSFEFIECKDVDGNNYPIVKIGTQIWMAENLKVEHYRDGTPIQNITTSYPWSQDRVGAWCDFTNPYGHLYNWFATNNIKNIAPRGWHISTNLEWATLSGFLGGNLKAGQKLKEEGTAHWSNPKAFGTNESGFSAVASGGIGFNGIDLYGGIASYWVNNGSSTSYIQEMNSDENNLYSYWRPNNCGFSVRCVKD